MCVQSFEARSGVPAGRLAGGARFPEHSVATVGRRLKRVFAQLKAITSKNKKSPASYTHTYCTDRWARGACVTARLRAFHPSSL